MCGVYVCCVCVVCGVCVCCVYVCVVCACVVCVCCVCVCCMCVHVCGVWCVCADVCAYTPLNEVDEAVHITLVIFAGFISVLLKSVIEPVLYNHGLKGLRGE